MTDEKNKNVENEKDFSTFFVNLPSKGKLYKKDSPLREGSVEMRRGTTYEEDILLNESYINKGVVFEKLLESLIVNEAIDYNDLVLGDFNTLMIETKKSLYGPKTKTKLFCPRCNEEIRSVININELEVFMISDDVESNEFEFKSSQGNTFKYHIMTYGEDKKLKEQIKKRSQYTGNTNSSVQMSDRLVQIIDELNGDDSPNKIRNYVKNRKMSSMESRELRNDVLNNTPDIDLSWNIDCPYCPFEGDVRIPLTPEFFWNTGDDKRKHTGRSI